MTEKARIIDVVTLLDNGEELTLLTTASAADNVVQWLRKYIIMDDVKVKKPQEDIMTVEIMGPRSGTAVEAIVGEQVADFAKNQFLKTQSGLLIVRMPSPCDVSFYLIGSGTAIEHLEAALEQNHLSLPEVNDTEYEHLRITAGLGKLGHEWSESYNPLEAGLLHLTSFTKGCYIGQEVVARLDSYNKVKQRVMGFIGTDKLAVGDEVVADDRVVGVITSLTTTLDEHTTLALGYVRGEHAHEGAPITVRHDGTDHTFTLKLPPLED